MERKSEKSKRACSSIRDFRVVSVYLQSLMGGTSFDSELIFWDLNKFWFWKIKENAINTGHFFDL